MSEENYNIEEAANDILAQLKPTPPVKKENIQVTQEMNHELDEDSMEKQLEAYLLETTKRLIDNSMESVENLSTIIQTAPTPDDALAYASVIRSTNESIASMLNLFLSKKRLKQQMKIKKMDIDSKKDITETRVNAVLTMTREEALAKLIGEARHINTNSQILSC